MGGVLIGAAYVGMSYVVDPQYLGTQDYAVRREREGEREREREREREMEGEQLKYYFVGRAFHKEGIINCCCGSVELLQVLHSMEAISKTG